MKINCRIFKFKRQIYMRVCYSPWIVLLSEFLRSLTVHSPCAQRGFSVRLPSVHCSLNVHSFALSATLRSLSQFIKRSPCAQCVFNAFSVRSPFKFNSFLLPFGTPNWKERLLKLKNKNKRLIDLSNERKFIKWSENMYKIVPGLSVVSKYYAVS